MGRKINFDAKQNIEHTARKLFLEKGYTGTSYADIAAAIGKEKSYVQRHFPRKDIFLYNFFSDLLDAADDFFVEHGMKSDNYYVNLFLIGQLQYALLLSTPETRRFTCDILSHRALTGIIIDQDMNWASDYLNDFSIPEQEEFRDNVALVMGGIYELLFRQITEDRLPKPRDIQLKSMRLLAFEQDIPQEDADNLFESVKISDELFADAVKYLTDVLFKNE